MGVFRSVPVIKRELPFLWEVDFSTLAQDLAIVNKSSQERTLRKVAGEITGLGADLAGNDLIRKYPSIVAMQEPLNKLRLGLGPVDGKNSVFISGPRGSGKTTLMEALVRTRAQGGMSGKLGTKPFFIFDVTKFITSTMAGSQFRIAKFQEALKIIADSNGILLMDHIDDLVNMSQGSSEATILLMELVTTLEQNRRGGMQAIVAAEDSNRQRVMEACDSLGRAFSDFSITKAPTADTLKDILLSTAVKLQVGHNLRYSEEAVDEAIRLLSRFPGRAFMGSSPENAIELLDMAGAYVRRNQYAEPPKLTEMREHLANLRDQYMIVSEGNDSELTAKLAGQITDLGQKVIVEDKAWREKFGPLFKAKDNLAKIERELPPLRAIRARTPDEHEKMRQLEAKQNDLTTEEKDELRILKNRRDRTPQENEKFDLYVRQYEPAQQAIVAAEAALNAKIGRVCAEDVRAVFNAQAGIAVRSPAETRQRMQKTGPYLETQVFGQSKAVETLANAYNASRKGTKDPNKPTVLLFAGGSGLGKTEIAKALVRWDLGLEDRPDLADSVKPIKVNMSEFGDSSSVSKIEGAAPGLIGYGEVIPWHEEIRANPFGVLLLDEADKAHPSVFLRLMEAFDAGDFKDSSGKPLPFKDLIVIVCMNGITADDIPEDKKGDATFIFDKICKVKAQDSNESLFTPAIVNRFDQIVIFENLDNVNLVNILRKKDIRKLNEDFREQGVSVTLDQETAEALIQANPNKGAGGRGPSKLVNRDIRPALNKYVSDRDERLDSSGQSDIVRKDRLQIKFDGKMVSLEPIEVTEAQPVPVAFTPSPLPAGQLNAN